MIKIEASLQQLADSNSNGKQPNGLMQPVDVVDNTMLRGENNIDVSNNNSKRNVPAQPDSKSRQTAIEFFIAKLAESLHQYGTPSHELEDILQSCSEKLSVPAAFFSTPTAIFISFPESEKDRTVLRRVTPGEIDLEKLVAVNKVVASFLDDKIDTVSATEKLDSIATQKSSFSNSVYVLAFAVASGAVVSFFGGGVNEVFVTGLIGLLVGCLELIARWSPNFGRAYSAVAAISAAFLAVVASKLIPGLSSQIVTLGSLIVLVPGLSVTMAVSELSRQHLASGTSRFMGAILQFLILAFGVSFGRNVAVQLFEPAAANVLAQPQWLFWACLSISPISFAVLFRTRKKDVLLVALTCIIGFFCGNLGREVLGNELGPALGSFSIAVFSNFVSRFFRQPPELTLVPGLMFLVPGSIGFLGLQSFVQHQTLEGIQAAFTVLFVSSALVSGLLLANVFVAPRKW